MKLRIKHFVTLRSVFLFFAIALSQVICAQSLPKTVTTSFTGFPTRTFELKTDNLLYETTSGSPVKISNVLFSNITYNKDEFPIMQCTRLSDGVIIGYELRGGSFMETLHTIVANGVSYSLKPNRDIYHVASNQKIGEQADYIRNENNHFLKVALSTGNLFLYKGTPNLWEQIKQIVTLKGVSYIVKTDNSLWAISLNNSQTLLGQNVRLILANDKNTSDELVILSTDGTYKQYNWTSQTWCTFTPNVLSASPVAYEPGIWFVIQNQSALDASHIGIKANSDGSITTAVMPATGSFDEFLWSTEKFNSSYRIINKKFGTVLDLNANPQTAALKSRSTSTTQLWNFNSPNAAIYGTNAFTITNNANATVLELQGSTVALASVSSNAQQTWVVQPMDLVTGYRLPFNLGSAQEQAVYNKILKIPSGPYIYGTNTVTEWGVLMTYFVVQNMINAEKSKSSIGTYLQNHKVVLIGKDDTYPAVAFYPIISGREQVKLLRGLSSPLTLTIVSEELMGRSGVVNSFVSTGYRKTDHVTHEFGHSMDGMYGWNGSATIPNSSNAFFNSIKSELVAASVQAWFDDNSDGSYPDLPQTRQEQMSNEPAIYAYMAGKFNETNIWKPALQLRDYPQPTVTGDPLVGKSGTQQTDLCNNAHVTPTPVASINPTTSPLCAPAAVSFIITGTPDAIVTYSINNGPENTVTLANGTANINVSNPTGNQTLQLISVVDASGIYSQFLSSTASILVYPVLTPTMSAPNGNCVGSELSITGAATASQVDWLRNGTIIHTAFANSVTATNGNTVAGTGTAGSAITQLNNPADVFVDASGNVFIADQSNNRVQKWAPGATSGVTVATGNYISIHIDGFGNIYGSDYSNHKVEKWVPGATSAVIVAGGNGQGNAADQLSLPKGIFVDINGNVFVADYDNHRIQKWAPGATSGTTVAGINGFGDAANQLGTPNAVYLDAGGNIYVSEQNLSRIKKFPSNSISGTDGVVVAQGTGGNAVNFASDVYVDGAGFIYVSSKNNHKVLKFPPNATSSTPGTAVAGNNGQGNANNQLNSPSGVFVDGSGNLFIADQGNHRVQKWEQTTTITETYSPTTAGDYTAIVTTQNGCASTTSPAVTINPIQQEIADGIDNNCNGAVDENSGLHFDGVNDYVTINNAVFPAEMTFETWLKLDSKTSAARRAIFAWRSTNSALDFYAESNGTLRGFESNGSNLFFGTIPDDQWHHYALIRGAGKLQLYVDGVFSGEGNSTQTLNIDRLTLGAAPDGSTYHMAGTFDETRIWNYAKTPAEIQADVTCTSAGTTGSLVAYFDFNEGAPNANNTGRTTIYDYSGNSLIGTLTNFALSGLSSNFVDGYTGTEINVKGNGNSIVGGDTTPTTTDNTDFENTCVGTTVSKTFTIENVGTEVLNVTGITVDGGNANGFTTNFTSALAINPGTSADFTVSFNPTATGNYSDVINITSNDCDEALYTFAVSGSSDCGTATPDAPTVGAINQPTCSTPTGSFTITNYNAGYTYAFSPAGPTISGAGNVTAAPGNYTLTATNNGQTSAPSTQITINAQPASPAIPTTGAVTQPTCSNATGSFTITNYNAGFTYTFSPSGPNINGSGVVTAAAGTYQVIASNGGCTSGQSGQVIINAQPASPATPTTGAVTQPTCSNATGSFTITNFNASVVYTFSPSGPTINGSGVVTASAGSYRITAAQGGCTSAQSNLITINPQPATPSVPSTGTVTNPSCSGQTGSFTVTNYSASFTYSFSPVGPTINGSGVVTAGAGTYTVTATNGNGCSATSAPVTITVTDNQPPTFSNNSLTAPPALALANIPEASGYSVIFEPNISVSKDYNNNPVDYLVNNSAATGVSYNRVAYFMQLDDKWVWVSMDKFNNTLNELGLPNAVNNNVVWQRTVNNMNVVGSSNSAVTNGTGLNGNIEMWHHCYNPNFGLTGIPTGNNSKHDINDFRTATSSCYGSFQIHNYSVAQTLFAYNAWDEGGLDEMGIGNNPDLNNHPDWTFARNIADYTTKKLYILVNANASACPNNITVTANNRGGAVVNYTTPVGSDNCSGVTTTRTAGLATGSTFPVGNTTVTHRATDAAGNTTDCSFTVTVEYTNLLPIVSTSNGSTTHTEGSPVVVDAGITLSDADNTDVVSASVSIIEGFSSAEDELQFTNQNGITGTYNAATGVLSLIGSASVADYQAALASIAYINNSANPNTANRAVSFVVNDGTDNSTAATKLVTVIAVNDAPTLNAISDVTIDQNAATQTINLAGITDGGDGRQELVITAVSDNTSLIPNPTVTYTNSNTTGSLSFTPVSGASGTATITITVSDDGGTANGGINVITRTFVVTVEPLQITTGEALRFDGSNDYVNVPNTTTLPQGNAARSVEAWVKTTQLNHLIGNIVSWGNRNNPSQRNSVAVRTGRFAFIGQGNDHMGTVPINDGLWHYVVFTLSGNTLKLYVDGVLDVTRTTNTLLNTTGQDLRLGVNALGRLDEYFNGTMDEVRIWNKSLSQAEITENYGKCSLEGTETGLIAYYRFNQGDSSGNNAGVTTLTDQSASGYNGTLTNFALTGSTSNWVAPGAPTCILYYRSITSGDWNSPNTWESSSTADFSTGVVRPATIAPDYKSAAISIQGGHTINVTAPVAIDQTFVEPNGTLKVTGTTITVINKGLTIRSAANGSGSIGTSTGTIAGNVNVERYIPAHRAWTLVTAPVRTTTSIYQNWQNNGIATGTTGVDIWGPVAGNGILSGPAASIKTYNPANNTWVGVSNTQAANSISGDVNNTANNKGFLLFATGPFGSNNIDPTTGSASTTLSATGSIQMGDQSLNINPYQYSLVGNPYPSPVKFQNVKAHNSAITDRFWTWDANLSTYGAYRLVYYDNATSQYKMIPSLPGSTAQSAGDYVHLQSGQAVFVENATWNGATGSAGTLTFAESDKSTTQAPSVFRGQGSAEEVGSMSINMFKGTRLLDGTLGLWSDTYSNDIVAAEDAGKPTNTNENISIVRNGRSYMVEARNNIKVGDTMRLWVWGMSQAQTYELVFSCDNLPLNGLVPYLEDRYLNTSTMLFTVGNTSYNFSTPNTAAMSYSRFHIVFKEARVLSVDYTSVKAVQKGLNRVEVSWQVSNEHNIVRYEVEKSSDGRVFMLMGFVPAIGNGAASQAYFMQDMAAVQGFNYYRIKSVEANGAIKYSKVVHAIIGAGEAPSITVFPNPVAGKQFTLRVSNLPAGKYALSLFDGGGRKVMQKDYQHVGGNGTVVLQIPSRLGAGAYKLEMKNQKEAWVRNIILQP